jgi:hypothetical protein
MSLFTTQISENKLLIQFTFNKNKLVFSGILYVVILSLLVYALFSVLFSFTFLISSLIALGVITWLFFKDYFEWLKNKQQLLEITTEGLFINQKLFLKAIQVPQLYCEYSNAHTDPGYSVYIESFTADKKYIIKNRLSEKEGFALASVIAKFLKVKTQTST